MALNNRTIAAAPPGARIWDDQVRGLCLRVSATGRKAFYLVYRTRTGRQRGPKLADLEVMTLAQAREAAREMLAKVAVGGDPVADWRNERVAPTVAELGEQWLADHGRAIKPGTLRLYRIVFTKHIAPRLGALKVVAVQHADVDGVHKSLAGTPYLANRVLAAASCMFSYAEKHQMRPLGSNPCAHVHRFPEKKRKRYMRRAEAPSVAVQLAAHEANHTQAVAFIYLLILTGARPAEIASARREWIEPAGVGGVLRLPDSKTGARPVYLPPPVMRIVSQLPITSTGRLFQIKSPKALWNKIRVEAGAPDLRLYDLRHTFASAALEAGYSLSQIGELLGHASTQTTKRYAHLVDEKAHEVAADTAGLLERMMSGGDNQQNNERGEHTPPPAVDPIRFIDALPAQVLVNGK